MREEKEEKLDVTLAPLAYKKIVYHLVRYPTSKVTGAPYPTQASSWAISNPSSTSSPSSIPLSSTLPSVWLSI